MQQVAEGLGEEVFAHLLCPEVEAMGEVIEEAMEGEAMEGGIGEEAVLVSHSSSPSLDLVEEGFLDF